MGKILLKSVRIYFESRYLMFKFFITSALFCGFCVKSCPFTTYDEGLIDSLHPIFQTELTFSTQSPADGDSFGFGFWNQCIPLWTVKQSETIDSLFDKSQEEQGQLLFLMKSDQEQRNIMLYYVNFDQNIPSITQNIQIVKGGQQASISKLFPTFEYEGIWIFTYFTFQAQEQQIVIEMTSQEKEIISIQFGLGTYKLFIGGQGYIGFGQQFYNLNFYRGRLSKLISEENFFYDQNHFTSISNLCSIPPKVIEVQTVYLVKGLKQYFGNSFDSFQIEEYGNRYSISGWGKCDLSYVRRSLNMVLIQVSTQQQYKLLNKIIGDSLFSFYYSIDSLETQYGAKIFISSDQYNIPLPYLVNYWISSNNLNFQIFDDSISNSILKGIQQWHFFKYEYGRTSENHSLFTIQFNLGEPFNVKFGTNEYNGSYTNTLFYFMIGSGGENTDYFSGWLWDLKFTYNYQEDQLFQKSNLLYHLVCHYSCSQCYGPLQNNCLFCPLNSNRIFISDKYTCQCLNNYLDKDGEPTCLAFSDEYTSVIEIHEVKYQTIICEFGYFQIPTKENNFICVQWQNYLLNFSPQQQSNFIICIDCLFYPQTWFLKPICKSDMVRQQQVPDSSYQLINNDPIDYDVFIIDINNNLQILLGVQNFCDSQKLKDDCHETKQLHLGNLVNVVCKRSNFFFDGQCRLVDEQCQLVDSNGLCQLCKDNYYHQNNHCINCPIHCIGCSYNEDTQYVSCLSCIERYALIDGLCQLCGTNCKICQNYYDEIINKSYLKCYKCISDQLYMLSLDAINCIDNPIENCEIAFQISADDYTINSLDYYFTPQYLENIVTFCGRCVRSYRNYVLQTLTCEESVIVNCILSISNFQNPSLDEVNCIFADFGTQSIIENTDNCNIFIPYCNTCIFGKQLGFVQCVICQVGYFANRLDEICSPCPSELNCLECYQQNKLIQDNWKLQTFAIYKYFINSDGKHSFNVHGQSQNAEDYAVFCETCQRGYELYMDICIQSCPMQCLQCEIINGQNICIKCFSNQYGKELSLISNQCIECPTYCSLCRARSSSEISQINSQFFNTDFIYSTYQCLSPFIDSSLNLFYDQFFGQYINCQGSQDGCQTRFVIEINLFCSKDEYQSLLESLQTNDEIIHFLQTNIYVDELFSRGNSSFTQYEQYFFYQNANEKSISTIDIRIVSKKQQTCMFEGDQIISQQFSHSIFTAINVSVSFIAFQDTFFQFDRSITFANFSQILFQGIIFQPLANQKNKLLLFQSQFLQSIQFNNCLYQQINEEFDFSQIVFNNLKSLHFNKFQIINMKQQNVQALITVNGGQQLTNLVIENILLTYNNFYHTNIFQLNLEPNLLVTVSNISVASSSFQDGKLFNFNFTLQHLEQSPQGAKLFLSSLRIESEIISTDGFLNFVLFSQANIQDVAIINCKISNSVLLKVGNIISIYQFSVANCYLFLNSVLLQNQGNSNTNSLMIVLNACDFEQNQYDESSQLINFQKWDTFDQQLTSKQLYFFGNAILSLSNENLQKQNDFALVIFNGINNISLIDIIIERGIGYQEFSIINTQYLQISRLTINQSDKYQFRALHQYLDCLLQYLKLPYYPPSIHIYQSQVISISNFTISKAYVFSFSLLEVIVTEQLMEGEIQSITISDGVFESNLLIITQQRIGVGLIQIQSQQQSYIILSNIKFYGNVLLEYIQSQIITSATLINLNCIQCDIQLISSVIDSNVVINSTDSIIYIKAKSINIQDCVFINNAQFIQEIISPLIIWGGQTDVIYLEQLINIFRIISFSGNGEFISKLIKIHNCQISNSTGSKGGAFKIDLQLDAYFEFVNISVSQVGTFFKKDIESGGALYINSFSTLSSQIKLTNISFYNIYCRGMGGIFYIVNGEGKLDLQLLNLKIQNTYAKQGSVIYCSFLSASNSIQSLLINGLTLANDLVSQAKFLSKFTNYQDQEIMKVVNQRVMFYIQYGTSIILKNLLIRHIYYESMIYGESVRNVLLSDIKIENCIFPIYLINIIPIANKHFNLMIEKLEAYNLTQMLLSRKQIDVCSSIEASIQSLQFQCFDIFSRLQILNIQAMTFGGDSLIARCFNILTSINQETQNQSGVLFISDLDSNQSITITRTTFKQLDCSKCDLGIVYISGLNSIQQKNVVTISNILIIDSLCGRGSCITLSKGNVLTQSRLLDELHQSIAKLPYEVYISEYICINNTANSGTCITISQFSAKLANCIFEQNSATNSGGAIELISTNSGVDVIDSVIMQNKAQIGAGVYSPDSIVKNFIKLRTTIQSNVASTYGDDYASSPSSLQVFINQKQEFFDTYTVVETDNILIQGLVNDTFVLQFPSGHQISEYYYYDWKSSNYIYPKYEFQIVALDFNKIIQKEQINKYCTIRSRLVNLTGEQEQQMFTNNYTNIEQKYFDNKTQSFNFNDLILSFDYEAPPEIVLQLEFWCSSIIVPIFSSDLPFNFIKSHNNYYLRVNIRTLPCTYGQIKSPIDQSCNMCNSSLDQFSLQINALKCEVKDDLTTLNVKSAQLQLKSHYWRPYFDTSEITYCLNLPQNCQGGWIPGQYSCIAGHIGALCEQCDLYNIRGNGEYGFSEKYSCGLCSRQEANISIMIATIIWTFISLMLSVKSTLTTTEKHYKVSQSKIIGLKIFHRMEQSGVLIKIMTNYLQIIASLTTFQLQFPSGINNTINLLGNPVQTISYSQDCVLSQFTKIEIHYSRILWQFLLPYFFLVLFFLLYAILVKIKTMIFNLGVITTSTIYMFLYFQPNIVNGLIQLMSYRKISGYKWIQNNVAYRYDTELQTSWLLKFCLPSLIFMTLLIPIGFLSGLYYNRNNLSNKDTKIKWGYLFNEYKVSSYFWEIIKIIEKDLIIIALISYEDDVVIKGILMIIIVSFYQELNQLYQPYYLEKFNKLDYYSSNISSISFMLGIGIYMGQQHNINQISTMFYLLIIIINMWLFLLLIRYILDAYFIETEIIFDTIRGYILKYLPKQLQNRFLYKFLENRSERRKKIQANFYKIKQHLILQAKQIKIIKKSVPQNQSKMK